ncbi:putative disease resistance protein [Senna tora]|uniref:Putative disease resistance protein n=1 Tax=Senna tora TaxID=362788 RepID=A0A834WLB2_9FABA|nr:putative disease resistance protein [Senna tora]
MADFEIIDLTDSPPSSPPPSSPPRSRSIRRRSRRILSFRASASSRTILFKIIRRPNENPSSEYLTRHMVPWIPPTPTGQISQAVNEFHSTMHGGEPQFFQPFPGNDPNMAAPVTTFLVTKHGEIWTQHEHEEFVKGLGNCGGCWERIASEFVMTKTAAEVESYAESFFRHLTQICLHSLDMFVEESSILTIPCAAMVEEPPTTRVWDSIEEEEDVNMIGLYGMGGSGKTTLMKKLNNEFAKRRHDFALVIWVVVSKDRNTDRIMEDIRQKCRIGDMNWNNRCKDEKAIEIYRVMKQKNVHFVVR